MKPIDASTTDVMLPIGMFCPFKSDEMTKGNLLRDLAQAFDMSQRYMGGVAQLAQLAQAGIDPEKQRVEQAGRSILAVATQYKKAFEALETTPDFQSAELWHTMQCHNRRQGLPDLWQTYGVTRWQGEALLASAEGRSPPLPPVGVDMQKLAQVAPGTTGSSSTPAQSIMPPASLHAPFEPEQLEGAELQPLRLELERLQRDHEDLIGLGQNFRSFDPDGQGMFLDRMADIHRRWDEMILDARAAGAQPSTAYLEDSRIYCRNARMTPAEWRAMVAESHEALRKATKPSAEAR